MSPRRRTLKRLVTAFLPIVLVIAIAVGAVMVWIVNGITRPPRAPYLVTPQTFAIGPILKASDATWSNHDGTKARGWLVPGAEGAPAVILLPRYRGDRWWVFYLSRQLKTKTNFSVARHHLG